MLKNNWITSLCGNTNKRFNGIPCKYYEHEDKQECRLLKEQKTDEFWKKCRCAWDVFMETANKTNEKLQGQYKTLPVDDREDVDFGKIIEQLKKNPLTKGYNISNFRLSFCI
jgi:hypothetical protein